MTERRAGFEADQYAAASPESAPYWRAAAEGRLLGKVCNSCASYHWYPRAICPFCRSSDTTWREASGFGTIYAFSTLRRARPPYTVAYVQLEEGPTVLTNLVGAHSENLVIGMRVKAVFELTAEGRSALKFTPISRCDSGDEVTGS